MSNLSDWLAPASVAGITVALVQFFAWWSSRGKVRAEAADTVSGAAVELIEPYRTEVKQLRVEIGGLRDQITELETSLRRRESRLDEQSNLIQSQTATINKLGRLYAALADWAQTAYVTLLSAQLAIDPPPVEEHDLE